MQPRLRTVISACSLAVVALFLPSRTNAAPVADNTCTSYQLDMIDGYCYDWQEWCNANPIEVSYVLDGIEYTVRLSEVDQLLYCQTVREQMQDTGYYCCFNPGDSVRCPHYAE